MKKDLYRRHPDDPDLYSKTIPLWSQELVEAQVTESVDAAFLDQFGLAGLSTQALHRQLTAFYLYGVMALASPEDTGWAPLDEADQHALREAVWIQDYDTYRAIGGLMDEQVYAQTFKLAECFDDVYEVYQRARFRDADPGWHEAVTRFFLGRVRHGSDPTQEQVRALDQRLRKLVAAFQTGLVPEASAPPSPS
ncbi:MAG: hypothetical protein M3Q71_04190 [Chloroflexota bacterium]|nr:hypothetical protein [Chloroflexota bacterium]